MLNKFVDAGEMIGNHTYDHPHLDRLTADALRHQIEGCSKRIAQVTGRRPRYFRPPFGESSPLIERVARAAGTQQMLWNANSQDSWQKDPRQILYWSIEEAQTGSILLMHDKPQTAAVLDRVLTKLQHKGFRFVLPE